MPKTDVSIPVCSCTKPSGNVTGGMILGLFAFFIFNLVIGWLIGGFSTTDIPISLYTIAGTVFGYTSPDDRILFSCALIITGVAIGIGCAHPGKALVATLLFLVVVLVAWVLVGLMALGVSYDYDLLVTSIATTILPDIILLSVPSVIASLGIYGHFRPREMKVVPNPIAYQYGMVPPTQPLPTVRMYPNTPHP